MTEQEILDELERSIASNNRNNLDIIKVLNGSSTQDVSLQDGSVVPSLSKRVKEEVVEDSNYLYKSDNLASVEDKATARTNLNVPSVEEMNIAITNATPNATETIAGKAKIATTAIAQAGTSDTDFMTPLKTRYVSFGQGQTRKSRTLVSGVEYTNALKKPIVVGFSLRSNQGVNAQMLVNIKLGDITVTGNTLSGTTDYRSVYEFTILPQEKYMFTIGNSTTFFDVAWEIS